mmetsp:Transcript_45599/g.62153  ORF Transcript_45599/g.62153 Transcript_45599/m.62153 type:complete len:91 (-) Transcript_45599:237-509(-)
MIASTSHISIVSTMDHGKTKLSNISPHHKHLPQVQLKKWSGLAVVKDPLSLHFITFQREVYAHFSEGLVHHKQEVFAVFRINLSDSTKSK